MIACFRTATSADSRQAQCQTELTQIEISNRTETWSTMNALDEPKSLPNDHLHFQSGQSPKPLNEHLSSVTSERENEKKIQINTICFYISNIQLIVYFKRHKMG